MISLSTIAGIPKLLKKSPKAIGMSLIGAAVSKLTNFLFGEQKWGVYKAGTSTAALDIRSVLELDITCQAQISDYPIETGSFTSYNKVRMPNDYIVRITNDGSKDDRAKLIKWLGDNTSETSVFDIICPEGRLSSVTLASFHIVRNRDGGVSMLTVDCYFRQVRFLPAKYSSTTVAAPANKPTPPTVSINAIASSVIKSFPLPPLAKTAINVAGRFM